MLRDIFNAQVIDRYNEVLNHPFLRVFEAGELSHEAIKKWCNEQAWLSLSFASNFEAISLRMPWSANYWDLKRKLSDLIRPESWSSGREDTHPSYFREMFNAIAPEGNLDAELGDCLPSTKEYVDGRIRLLTDEKHSIFYALGALAIHEYLNADTREDPSSKRGIMASILNGLKKMYPENEAVQRYASAHVRDECDDFSLLDEIRRRLETDIRRNPALIDKYPLSFQGISDPDTAPHKEWNEGASQYLKLREIHLNGLQNGLLSHDRA